MAAQEESTDEARGAGQLVVRPGSPLRGSVRVGGSKNAALPLLAAAAASGLEVRVENVPGSTDAQVMLGLLSRCGYRVEPYGGGAATIAPLPGSTPARVAGAARIRASYYLVPALLASFGRADLPWPGGCSIGDRGMDVHFKVYEAFGDAVRTSGTGYRVVAGQAPPELTLGLPFRSRGASIVAVLRAVVAGSRLRLGNPNLSPETVGVVEALACAGWQASVTQDEIALAPPTGRPATAVWAVPGDKVEAGTLACAVAATGGSARIEGVRGRDVEAVVARLRLAGIEVVAEADRLTVDAARVLATGQGIDAVASLDPAGLDADFEPPMMALALGLHGKHVFGDAINPGRHSNLIPQLRRMGAEVEEESPTLCRLSGPQRLVGASVEATDIRTGSALLIAGLTARGATTVSGLEQLRRGHADLPSQLRALGADIQDVPS